MDREKLIVRGILLTIAGAIALRVWWYWPTTLPGGKLLDRIELRGGDYKLFPKPDTPIERIVDISIFDGYHRSSHGEFKEAKSESPSRWISAGEYHGYSEYVTKHGRLQLHSAYQPSSEDTPAWDGEWMEFLPVDIPVDSFFDEETAIRLDLSVSNFKVYIPHKGQRMYMTVTVKDRKVSHVFWGPHP